MTELADTLFEAHVKHELSRLGDDRLPGLLAEWIAAVFRWGEEVRFNDVVTREEILGVIDRYVIELKVSGGITELAGEMSNVVFSSGASARTRVSDVVRPEAYWEFAEKVAALGAVQRELTRFVIQSAAFGTLASRMVSRLVLDLVFRKGDARPSSPVTTLLAGLRERILPGFERRVAAALSRYVEEHAGRLAKSTEEHILEVLDPDAVRAIADEIWDSVSTQPLTQAATYFTAQDLEDFVVLGYEFWLKFRKTPYFRAVAGEVVNHLFEKYGDESLASVVGDMGVTEEMVTGELQMFAGPIVEHALRTGFLEQQLRSYLEPFYRSEELRAILGRLGTTPSRPELSEQFLPVVAWAERWAKRRRSGSSS